MGEVAVHRSGMGDHCRVLGKKAKEAKLENQGVEVKQECLGKIPKTLDWGVGPGASG